MNLDELKSGIESLIGSSNVDIKKQLKVPLPSEPRPLYEVIQEVKTTVNSNDIYAPSHGYALPSHNEQMQEVNIQKTVEVSKDAEKEEDKKKKDKKDKYKVKF